jgi:DNA topoisomerase-1
MPKNLVIVESPSKSKTIEKYLGPDYKVVSSVGHIRNLAKTGPERLGVNIENGFEPSFSRKKDRIKMLNAMKKEAKTCDNVYLATDPDREGEAISWHLAEVLELDVNLDNRIVFNEITKNAVLSAFDNARTIDMGLVNSQITRRVLDRIIGFKLSNLMRSKINSQSAGRVQSVALKLIVDKEREREAFIKEEYWTVDAHFNGFKAELSKIDGVKAKLTNEEETNTLINSLSDDFLLEDVVSKERSKGSKLPYKTSTMQQDSSRKLNFPAAKTMRVAQSLYEGVALESETVGLITYMRTDSTRLSNEFTSAAFDYIKKEYGSEYVGKIKVEKKNENSQDAHEGIRPTSVLRTPKSVKKYLKADQFKLYSMIYARAVASLMSNAKFDSTTFHITNNQCLFNVTGQVIKFDGYLKVYGDYEQNKDEVLPLVEKGTTLKCENVEGIQHFTQPPARYTEAKLIKEMEELGIGRPSTYAQTMDTIKKRKYVDVDQKRFIPTEQGILTIDSLSEYFSEIINIKYTANMENDLDIIAESEVVPYSEENFLSKKSVKVLQDFYEKFMPMVKVANDSMQKIEAKPTGEMCPECGEPLVFRKGRYGEFVGCSNFPTCKYIKQEEREVTVICKCPNCEEGNIVEKKTRRGKLFYGCDNYPKCKTAYWDKPTGNKCPECSSMLVEKKNGIACSECDYKQ